MGMLTLGLLSCCGLSRHVTILWILISEANDGLCVKSTVQWPPMGTPMAVQRKGWTQEMLLWCDSFLLHSSLRGCAQKAIRALLNHSSRSGCLCVHHCHTLVLA